MVERTVESTVENQLQVDTATRERALESQLHLARQHLSTAGLQTSQDTDVPPTSTAELTNVRRVRSIARRRPADLSLVPPHSGHRLVRRRELHSRSRRAFRLTGCARASRRLAPIVWAGDSRRARGPSRVGLPNLGTGTGRRAEAGRGAGRAQHCPPLVPQLSHVTAASSKGGPQGGRACGCRPRPQG